MRLLTSSVALLLVACAPASPGIPSPAAVPLRIAVLGDMPYADTGSAEWASSMAAYKAVLDTIAAERVAFVVHVGDITGRNCSDSLFAQRVREFAAMPHPLVYTFGDNEWTDCERDQKDPIERLNRLRTLFTPPGVSLGARPMPLERQSDNPAFADFRENALWTSHGVIFLTLHVVGTNNNRKTDSVPNAEFAQRNAANIAWLQVAFARARRDSARGVAVFMQANPSNQPPAGPDGKRGPNGFNDLLTVLRELVLAFDKPVAVIHGDTHQFRVDKPFRLAGGRVAANVTRAETFGNPDHHAMLMIVDPSYAEVFRFEPILVRQNRR